jgi:hypothetical protein
MQSRKALKVNKPLKAKTAIKIASGRPKRKPKLKTISQLKKLADQLHSLATRYRFGEVKNGQWVAQCITCGIEKPIKQLQCGHFMSRQYNILRYSEENTAPQCYGCNVMHQGKQYEFGFQLDLLYGDGTAKRLHKESKTLHQFKREELEEIIDDRKQEILWYENHS